MSEQASFCTTCGSPLISGAQFCTSCGTPATMIAAAQVAAPAAAAPVAPAPVAVPVPAAPAAAAAAPTPAAMPAPAAAPITTDERIHAVIPNVAFKAGFMGLKTKSGVLVLTSRRVIFAQTTAQMMRDMVQDARDDAKSSGKGFFGQWGAQMSAYSQFAQRYLTMAPDDALAESGENFAIDQSSIVKSKLRAGHMNDDGATSSDRLIIKATGGKYEFSLHAGMNQAKTALIEAEMI